MIPLWQGTANTWDCDEMGHMNVRVYVDKMMEGLGAFAVALELPGAFSPRSPATLLPTHQHIRYIREVMPGRPLKMQGCVLDFGEDWVDVYQEIRHFDGTPAAAFRTRLAHITADNSRRFAWSERTLAALEQLKDTPPADTAPRSLQPADPCLENSETTQAHADAVGAPVIGRGMVAMSHIDPFGRMWAPWFIGRMSDSVPNLLFDWRKQVAEAAGDKRMGGAVLEYRLIYRNWPRAGDLFEMRSSLASVGEKTHSLVHWLVDPVSGKAWVTAEAVAVTFDLDARKILPTPKAQIDALEKMAPRGLGL